MFTPWLLRLLALLLIGGGGWALVVGYDYIVLDSGVAMVVAGTVGLVGGVVTLGLAGALARLEAIRRLLAALDYRASCRRLVAAHRPAP